MPRHKKTASLDRYALAPLNEHDAIQQAYGIGIEAAKKHLDAKDRMHLLFHATLSQVQSELVRMEIGEKISLLRALAPYTQKQAPRTLEVKSRPNGPVSPERAKKELAAMAMIMNQSDWDELNAERQRLLLSGGDGTQPIDAQLVQEPDEEDAEDEPGDEDE